MPTTESAAIVCSSNRRAGVSRRALSTSAAGAGAELERGAGGGTGAGSTAALDAGVAGAGASTGAWGAVPTVDAASLVAAGRSPGTGRAGRSGGPLRVDRAGADVDARGFDAGGALVRGVVCFAAASVVTDLSGPVAGAGRASGPAAGSSAGVVSGAGAAAGADSVATVGGASAMVTGASVRFWLRRAARKPAEPIETRSATAAAAMRRDLDDITDLPDTRALPETMAPR